jgi:hypothetical protein
MITSRSSLYVKCLSFFFFFFLRQCGGWGWAGTVTKERGIQEWLQEMSLYSAKINSKDHKCPMMLVNTEFCMALTDTVT